MPLQDRLFSRGKTAPERRFVVYFGLTATCIFISIVRDLADRGGLLGGRYTELSSLSELTLDAAIAFLVFLVAPQIIREMRRRGTATIRAQQSQGQIELLFKMTEMLQSALGHGDANSVLRSTASRLLAGCGGALYIFNNSGDRLELSTSWNWQHSTPPSEAITPSDCWAIKQGKLHLNLTEENALCCDHHEHSIVAMEIPMMARGEVYGLLVLERVGDQAAEELRAMADVASALADAMSLSLSNLALRERLRTQALRDALTGLYNRRYMEDALERYADQSARTQAPLSTVMIDLDHFKRLNDEHGHAMGDAVLADVASAILSVIRPCDIACRYGGEELVVLLPNCSLDEASAKAEVLRSRIERLSERHDIQVSASFGVSTFPETSKAKELLSDADKALYRAKDEGRNRVSNATRTMREIAAPARSKAA